MRRRKRKGVAVPRALTIIDDCTRESTTIEVGTSLPGDASCGCWSSYGWRLD